MIPRLRAGGEDVPGWPINGSIVETSRLQYQNVRIMLRQEQYFAAAVRAEAAFDPEPKSAVSR